MNGIRAARVLVNGGQNGQGVKCEAQCPACHAWFLVGNPSQARKRSTVRCTRCVSLWGLVGINWDKVPVI